MSEEYEALKAQKDELEKLSKEKCMNQGAAEERERLWNEIEHLGKWDYVSRKGWVVYVRDLKTIFGKDGEPNE